MPDNDPKWAAQKRCDNNRKDVKAERRKITNWVKDAEKELKTGLPISGRRKGRELKLQRRIAEQARQHPVDCLAAAREFLRQFKAEYDAPTPQPSDPISSGEGNLEHSIAPTMSAPTRFPSLFYLDHKNLTVPKRRL